MRRCRSLLLILCALMGCMNHAWAQNSSAPARSDHIGASSHVRGDITRNTSHVRTDISKLSSHLRADLPYVFAPPAVPTGLATSAQANTSMTVSWSASTGATSYTLYRSPTGLSGSWTQIASQAGTTYNDSGLTAGNTYHYEVSATGAFGTSANSADAFGTCTGGGAATSWVGLGDPFNNSNQYQIWDIEEDANHAVYVASTGGIIKSTNAGASWTTISGITNVTAIGWASDGNMVAAESTNGSTWVGMYKLVNGAWTQETISSGTPSFRVTKITKDSSGNLLYADAFSGHADISTDNGAHWSQINGSGSGFTSSGALWNIAVDSSGNIWIGGEFNGPYYSTNDGSAWTQTNVQSPAPGNYFAFVQTASGTNIIAQANGSTGYSIFYMTGTLGSPTWNGVTLASSPLWNVHAMASDRAGYTWLACVSSSGTSGTVYKSAQNSASSFSTFTTGLTSGVGCPLLFEDSSQNVYVDDQLTNGPSTWELFTLNSGFPSAPSAMGSSGITTSQVTLSWTANDTKENAVLLERSADGGVTWNSVTTLAGTATSYTDTGLTSGHTYFYRVKNSNVNGVSAPCAPLSVTMH